MAEHKVEKTENELLVELQRPESVEDIQINKLPAEAVDVDRFTPFEAELERGYREFDIKERKGRIHFPSVGDDMEISDHYARSYTIFLSTDGMMTDAELTRIYAERNIWTEDDEKKLESLGEDIENIREDIVEAQIDEKLDEVKKKRKMVKAYKRLKAANEMHGELNSKRIDLFAVSAESRAREVSIRQRMVCCVKDVDGNRIWPDIKALNAELDSDFYVQVLRSSMMFWSGIPEDFLGE